MVQFQQNIEYELSFLPDFTQFFSNTDVHGEYSIFVLQKDLKNSSGKTSQDGNPGGSGSHTGENSQRKARSGAEDCCQVQTFKSLNVI